MTMILWCIFALMTAAAIFAVVWPLGRKPSKLGGGSDLVVYKDQLQEIDRDRAAGLIGEAEAETARLEVSRRLLAAADTQPPSAPLTSSPPMLRRRRAAAIATLIILPFGPPSLYIALGSPNVPWEPAFARVDTSQGREFDRQPGQQGRGSSREQSQRRLRLGGDRAGLHAARPLRRRGRGTKKIAGAQWRQRYTSSRPRRGDDRRRRWRGHRRCQGGVRDALLRAIRTKRRLATFSVSPPSRMATSAQAITIWRSLLADAPAGAPWIKFVSEALSRAGGEQISRRPGTKRWRMWRPRLT